MAAGDISEIIVDRPNLALLVLEDEKADRPVDAGGGIGGHELRSKRWIAEDQKRRGLEFDAGIAGKLRLIDLGEEGDALGGHILLDAIDGLGHRIGALALDDAVVGGL